MAGHTQPFCKSAGFVHLMKFSAENPRLRKAARRYQQCKEKLKLALKFNLFAFH